MSLNPKGKLIGNIGELTPGMTKKFILENMPSMEILLDNRETLYAYRNRWPHIGISMD